jgi:hypothetical protein
MLAADLPVPPYNAGPARARTTALANAAIVTSRGHLVFAGQRDEPSAVDLGSSSTSVAAPAARPTSSAVAQEGGN